MKIIYKFPLPNAHNYLQVPVGSKFISVGVQNNNVMAWALCDADPAAKKEEVGVLLVPTGEAVDDSLFDSLLDTSTFIGVVFHYPFVFHAFQTSGRKKT